VTKLLQTAMDGVAVGSLYALIALGYTMVYGILRFINFAHSDVFMLGAWFSYLIARMLGMTAPGATPAWWGAPVAMVGSMLACGLLGYIIERYAYRPLRDAPRINVLITAIGVSLLIENAGQLKFLLGTQPERMPVMIPEAALFTVSGVDVHLVDVIVVGVALALMGGLEWLVYRTRLGLAMRAVSHDIRTAALMGIPVDAGHLHDVRHRLHARGRGGVPVRHEVPGHQPAGARDVDPARPQGVRRRGDRRRSATCAAPWPAA
jgi:branched-chain amino acid transport system permease protein